MLFFVTISYNLFAQKKSYQPVKHQEKYFASFYYSDGRARWVSDVSYTDLYNSEGKLINSANQSINFKIKNYSKGYGLDVAAPYGPLRLGLGINFENFYLDKIILTSTGGKAYLPFNENFRFDKIMFNIEYPLPWFTESRFSVNALGRLGYYGFSKLTSYNFFGGPYLGNTFLSSVGILADVEVVPRYYLFFVLNGEYKHYRNSGKEMPSVIIHRIFTGSAQIGLRINVFEYDFVRRIILGKD
jgi:hypothetical protein